MLLIGFAAVGFGGFRRLLRGYVVSLLLLAVFTAIAPASTAYANLIENGGFEEGNFNGWSGDFQWPAGDPNSAVVIQYNQNSSYPTGAYNEVIPPPAGGGNYGAYFSSDTKQNYLTQAFILPYDSIPLGPQKYLLTFDIYSPNNGRANPFDARLEVVANFATLTSLTSQTLPPGWNHFALSFVAGPPYSWIAFDYHGESPAGDFAADFVLDNVTLTAIPEKSTWVMLIVGFASVGYTTYRRRRVAVLSV